MSISRNAPCPCGSGKKYKRCCLAQEQARQTSISTDELLSAARSQASAGDLQTAGRLAYQATRLAPREAPAWALAGGIDLQQKKFAEARSCFNKAVQLQPANSVYLYNYATALAHTGDQNKAVEIFRQVLKLKPDLYQASFNLGNTLRDLGREEEAIACYLNVFESPLAQTGTMSAVLLSLHNFVVDEHERFYRMHCELGRKLLAGAPAATPVRRHVARRDNGKIRLGYISPRFSREIVGNFFKPLFDHHDRDKFELYLFSATARTDDLTRHFAAAADGWLDVTGLSDNALCHLIVQNEIDILVDLAGHAPESRISALARKPAPVQVAMIDYFDTTGIEAMDYYVTDPESTPPDSPQRFLEELIFLQHPRLVYEAPDYAPVPEVGKRHDNSFVFGSFNRHQKITSQVIETWSQLLQSVPGSTLLLKGGAFTDPDVRKNYSERFSRHGVAADRIEFRGRSPHAQLLAEYADMDIALDTFPYNGGLTTCEALWMGTPVLALQGNRIISRQSACMLKAVGLPGFVAQTPEEFVAIGQHWAAHRDQLNQLRMGLRQQMAASPLTDAAGYTREIEQQFERVWSDYLENGAP